VAALFTGYRFYRAFAGELPPPGSLSPQPDSEEAEELEMAVEEDEELAAGEGAEQQGGGAQAEPGGNGCLGVDNHRVDHLARVIVIDRHFAEQRLAGLKQQHPSAART
jgi:hypothetical protein